MAAELIKVSERTVLRGREACAAPEPGWDWPLREREAATAQTQTLAEANRRMDEFLGIATHELKSPVASSSIAVALAGRHLDTLLAQLVTEDIELVGKVALIRRLLRDAEDDMERLTRLVIDLLDVARIQTGRFELRLAHCDLASVVREAVEQQRRVAPTRVIGVRVPAQATPRVLADADRIRQVVTNYLTNALRYSQEDRPVHVGVYARGDWVHVGVQDKGPGLPRDEQRRIWERFHRAARVPVVSGGSAGLGLGLHICKTIMEQHQGRIGVRSAPGRGSTFWFALAVADVDHTV
jgi:signal transduction histidine kinase